MKSKRQVSWKILYDLLRGRKPLAIIGFVFICVSIFGFLPLTFIISSVATKPYERYDFTGIKKNGIEKAAKITFINSVNNVTINGEHPQIISYEYDNNGRTVSDKFETLDLEKIANDSVGQNIKILSYQNQTMIKGIEPFSFPIDFFYIFPGLFLLIGSIFLLIGLIPALKIFNLYKSGVVKEAYIISIISDTGMFPMRTMRQSFLVNYYFLTDLGNKVFGESATGDILFLNDKKEGDVIKILVSEQDENKSCLIPTMEAMRYNWTI